jgi:hypothetical protein
MSAALPVEEAARALAAEVTEVVEAAAAEEEAAEAPLLAEGEVLPQPR